MVQTPNFLILLNCRGGGDVLRNQRQAINSSPCQVINYQLLKVSYLYLNRLTSFVHKVREYLVIKNRLTLLSVAMCGMEHRKICASVNACCLINMSVATYVTGLLKAFDTFARPAGCYLSLETTRYCSPCAQIWACRLSVRINGCIRVLKAINLTIYGYAFS